MVKSRPEGCQGEPIGVTLRRPVTLGGQHEAMTGLGRVFGGGMRGRSCHVNQGELFGGGLVKVNQPGSSQSTHSVRWAAHGSGGLKSL